ncbi:MAG: hypothetical protein KBF36_05525 [Chitinophagaceae bacterium]|nr:hypothetical protein [Chitinophagaceae bacterium]MBP9741222.1 hypothetical protein [Chitinophagaceae bacterium]
MLVKLLASYYLYFWLLLCVIVVIKALFSFSFNNHLEGLAGLLMAVFKWYGEEDQEMCESNTKKIMMRLNNVITIGMYAVLLLIILVSLLPMFIPT